MKRDCPQCGHPLTEADPYVEVASPGARHRYHDVLCWDVHQITSELSPHATQIRVASEARIRETRQPTYQRAIHAAVLPSV
jgi:hypothetical protein